MTTGTDVTTRTGSALVDETAAAELYQAAGQGAEGVSADDMALPFIKVVQALSAEAKPNKPQFIKGVVQGDFANTVTRQVWRGQDGVWFVPVFYKRAYLEWGPEVGDGFKGEHGPDIMDKVTRVDNKNTLPDGNQIVITGVWYILVLDPKTGEAEPAVLSMASTQLKHSRALMSRLQKTTLPVPNGNGASFTPPLRYHVVRATTAMTSNAKGDWYAWQFTTTADKDADGVRTGLANGDLPMVVSIYDLPNGKALFARASELYKLASTGQVKTAAPDSETVSGADGGAGVEDGEEIPF